MDIGMLALLGKTVSLMENFGFLWLVHTGFELNLWECLLEEKSKEQMLAEHSTWDPLLLDHWLEQAKIQELLVFKNGNYQLSKMGKAIYAYKDYGLEAMYKEFALHWGPCFAQVPNLMRGEIPRRQMELEMENDLISKASRASEPFVWPLLREKCEKDRWRNVLDVGCGEAVFLRRLVEEFLSCHEGFEGLPLEREMVDLLEKTGFTEIEVIPLPFKVSHYFFATKPLD